MRKSDDFGMSVECTPPKGGEHPTDTDGDHGQYTVAVGSYPRADGSNCSVCSQAAGRARGASDQARRCACGSTPGGGGGSSGGGEQGGCGAGGQLNSHLYSRRERMRPQGATPRCWQSVC